MTGAADSDRALAPVRARIEREARSEADRVLAVARAEAGELLRAAGAAAERSVALARAQGQAQAAPLAAAERRRGRAQAQAIVLSAQREAYDDLYRQVLAGADALRTGPGYRTLADRLTVIATRAAGPEATVTSPPAGGVVARSGQTVVDCSLPRLAGLAMQALGNRVEELWAP
jgi:vacuolar-type H+-ATPase subunit E/Vma4